MRIIDDLNRKIYPAAQVADELGITAKELVNFVQEFKFSLFIEIPTDIEIYLEGIIVSKLPTTALEVTQPHKPKNHETNIKANPDVLYLCVNASDCELTLEAGSIKKSTFDAVAIFKKGTGVIRLTLNEYVAYSLSEKYIISYTSELFQTFLKSNQPTPSPISIRYENLLIGIENLQIIKQSFINPEPDYGRFIKGNWTSTMLAQLNEASTYFFSSPKPISSEKELIADIEEWLRVRWGKDRGADLINEAAKAIIPQSAKAGGKISEYILGISNDYTSLTLKNINEAAYSFWGNKNVGDKEYLQDSHITPSLEKEYKFKGRLSVAVSTIIRKTIKTK